MEVDLLRVSDIHPANDKTKSHNQLPLSHFRYVNAAVNRRTWKQVIVNYSQDSRNNARSLRVSFLRKIQVGNALTINCAGLVRINCKNA